MTTDRRFCRFSNAAETASFSITSIPEDGFCLSAFVLLRSRSAPSRVVMGRMNPAAPWDHIGALDPGRVEAHRHGWMLPSSHLIFGEAPEAAARRILAEQLGLTARTLAGPKVLSEVYPPKRHPRRSTHWDLGFLFDGEVREEELRPVPAWETLAFVDPRTLRAGDVARSHEDILAAAGIPVQTT